jgi:2-iminobutanoate/2-iminopropanoate deaminase
LDTGILGSGVVDGALYNVCRADQALERRWEIDTKIRSVDEKGHAMKDVIVTGHAPKPIGPYSQAVRANGLLFAAQIALDPNTNTLLSGDAAQQTERVLENLKAILTHAGLTLNHVVKTTVFLKDMNDFAAMSEVYAKYFPVAAPAGSTVQAAGLPKDALVEIELIAVL